LTPDRNNFLVEAVCLFMDTDKTIEGDLERDLVAVETGGGSGSNQQYGPR
jgi:hypothetical protein